MTWLVATLIGDGGGTWHAGQTLMAHADPKEFDKVARLYQACGTRPVALCEAAISVRNAQGAAESAPALAPPSASAAPAQSKGRR